MEVRGSEPSGDSGVTPSSILLEPPRRESIRSQDEVRLTCFDRLPPIHDGRCRGGLREVHRDLVESGAFEEVTGGDSANCGAKSVSGRPRVKMGIGKIDDNRRVDGEKSIDIATH